MSTHAYCGSDPDRQSVGRPGHCDDCCELGHEAAHPELGCADVGCSTAHPESATAEPITRALPVTWHPAAVQRAKDVAEAVLDATAMLDAFPVAGQVMTRMDLMVLLDGLRQATEDNPPAHRPMQIGTRDSEGYRTHAVPGDVCEACSDPAAGRWVPVSQCTEAMAVLHAGDIADQHGVAQGPAEAFDGALACLIDSSRRNILTEPPARTVRETLASLGWRVEMVPVDTGKPHPAAPCVACRHAYWPTHDPAGPGYTVRHPFRPVVQPVR